MYIRQIYYSRMLKLELPEFAEKVIKIVENHDPETLKINEMFNLLLAEQPQIDQLIVWYRAHPLSDKIKRLRDVRGLQIGKILIHLKVVQKEKGSQDSEVRLVEIEIGRYLMNWRECKNEEVLSQKLGQFFDTIDQSEELELAMSSLGFTAYLNELRNVISSIGELAFNREDSMSERPKVKTKDLEKSVIRALKNLFKEIDLAPLRNPELDYTGLINRLNELLDYYRNLINIRLGQSERKAEEKAKNENGELDNTTPVVESTEPAGKMMNLNAADKNGDGEKILPTNEKKTIATTWNSMQLPLDDNEAKSDANTN